MTFEDGQKIENNHPEVEAVRQDNSISKDSSEQAYEGAGGLQGKGSEVTRDEELGYASETDNLEKMILSTGIRVGTPVKTKHMSAFIVRANPEGLYILDISKTLARIDVAAKL